MATKKIVFIAMCFSVLYSKSAFTMDPKKLSTKEIEEKIKRRKQTIDFLKQENLPITELEKEITQLKSELIRRKDLGLTKKQPPKISLQKETKYSGITGLSKIKLPANIKSEQGGGWLQFSKTPNVPIPDIYYDNLLNSQSKFFSNMHIARYAQYQEYYRYKNYFNILKKIAFIDPDKGIYPHNIDLQLNVNLQAPKINPYEYMKDYIPAKFDYGELTKENFKEMKQEVIDGLATRYKIHLQVKPEYIVSFVKDFLHFITTDKYGQGIKVFKVATEIIPGRHTYTKEGKSPEHAVPIIVVYPYLIDKTKENKNKFITSILQSIINRYSSILKKIDLGVKPRYNKQIKDFIWVAGGDADDKKFYIKALDNKQFPRNTVYTDDFSFFKGHEFEWTPEIKKSK